MLALALSCTAACGSQTGGNAQPVAVSVSTVTATVTVFRTVGEAPASVDSAGSAPTITPRQTNPDPCQLISRYLGVPLVIRTGLPFIIEPHFSGRNDLLGGSLISFHCGGTFGIDGAAAATSQDVCKMNPSKLKNALSIAPSGFVVAMGIKFGLGAGMVVGFKAALFAGVTTTLAVAAGFTY